MNYEYARIEKKWQKKWDEVSAFEAKQDFTLPKYYALVEFPYPSGQGLHVGHPRPYTALDIVSRKKRMQGYNVLFPMGWDAFGLPTENFAIKNKIHEKDGNLVGKMISEGTTPRQLTDLIGSLCDLTSGSGDKGTPIVYIQGYFDNYTTE